MTTTMTAEMIGRTVWHGTDAHQWTITLTHSGRTMTIPFYQGLGITTDPTASDVLDCLTADAATIINGELDDLLGDMPYSEARSVADAMSRQTDQLRRLLGDDFDAIVFPS